MYKNKYNERNNISGITIANMRKQKGMSQRAFADMLQLYGLDIDKNAIQRIESGNRFVTDIELKVIAEALGITCDELLQ